VAKCVDAGTYDYFANSKVSYIVTFAGLGTIVAGLKFGSTNFPCQNVAKFAGVAGLLFVMVHLKNKERMTGSVKQAKTRMSNLNEGNNSVHSGWISLPTSALAIKNWLITANEWLGKKGYRQVAVVLNKDLGQIQVTCLDGKLLNHVSLSQGLEVRAFTCPTKYHVMISVINAQDLVKIALK
jgi:hypothetical protein